ncbi:MAG: DMT family transporter [Anaerovoracaceae bacterium]|jgi:drug/metabolite transporter (DMT)-like permease
MQYLEKNAKYVTVIGVILSSTSAIFTKLITAGPFIIGFYRLSLAILLFVIPALIKNRHLLKELGGKEIWLSMLGGFLLFCHFSTFFASVNYTKVASAVFITTLHPIVILFFTLFVFKKRVNMKAVLGILVALAGGFIIAGGDYSFSANNLIGDALAFSSAIFVGLYFLLGNKIRRNVSSSIYNSIVFSSCWVCFLISVLVSGAPLTGYSSMDYVYICLLSIFCQIIGHGVFSWCLGYVKPLFLSAWCSTQGIYTTVMAIIVFNEIPTLMQNIGGLLSVIGILYYNLNENARL